MLCVVAGYIALFVWLAIRRYEACLTQSGDTTVLECAFYNTLKSLSCSVEKLFETS